MKTFQPKYGEGLQKKVSVVAFTGLPNRCVLWLPAAEGEEQQSHDQHGPKNLAELGLRGAGIICGVQHLEVKENT